MNFDERKKAIERIQLQLFTARRVRQGVVLPIKVVEDLVKELQEKQKEELCSL